VSRTVPIVSPCATDCREVIIAARPASISSGGSAPMVIGHTRSATPLASPVDLSGTWNATDDDVASRFHPLYRGAVERLPDGAAVFRGLPFGLGSRAAGRRWLLVREPLTIDLRGHGRASHLVVAHFSDS